MFWVLAPISVLAALGMLLVKKAVHSALLLAWVMITLAIFYIAQD
ncbi:MAG: NADH-quinone oxidoreductase subunit J, partial [Actinobacteria bacterium]|nr:NADH-quinone oxidoreductase subunit J [Actinomycetota bacterium]